MPEELTEEQREAVEKLAEALNGADPRAELLRRAGELMAAPSRRSRMEISIDEERGVFMISVAAELARHAPADAADVRGARADRAAALAEEHAPLLAARTSSGCGGSSS